MKTQLLAALIVQIGTIGFIHASEKLPDLRIAKAPLRSKMAIDVSEFPGSKLLRFATHVSNIGRGALEIRGGEVNGDTQLVYQRIFSRGGSSTDRLAGEFVHHPTHDHTHFAAFAAYRVRARQGSAVGEIVAEGEKVSFCLMDSRLKRFWNPATWKKRTYRSCDTEKQGISAGWADVYGAHLPGQWVDITDLPNGDYWLEAEIDPENRLLESSEDNNITRVPFRLIGNKIKKGK